MRSQVFSGEPRDWYAETKSSDADAPHQGEFSTIG